MIAYFKTILDSSHYSTTAEIVISDVIRTQNENVLNALNVNEKAINALSKNRKTFFFFYFVFYYVGYYDLYI